MKDKVNQKQCKALHKQETYSTFSFACMNKQGEKYINSYSELIPRYFKFDAHNFNILFVTKHYTRAATNIRIVIDI